MNEEQIINAIKSGSLEQEVREILSGNDLADATSLNGIMAILSSLADRGAIRSFKTVSYSGATMPASWSDIQLTNS
jgi:hypothetical protein